MSTPTETQNRLQKMFADARQTHAYKAQGVSLEFTEDLVRLMEAQKVNNSELAQRIGASPAYVTKILRGGTNFTLDTMVKIATALDAEFRCHLQPAGRQTQWFDVVAANEEPTIYDPAAFKSVEIKMPVTNGDCAA